MYKYLLCFRYLTTRYIALVSIVSVMLGVATMIIVNSVMGGFQTKMRERLHSLLSDVVIESTSMDGFIEPDRVMAMVRRVCGDRVESMAPSIEIFGMLNFQNQGQGPHIPRPVRIIGIDPKDRSAVGEFHRHLINEENRKNPSFALRDDAKAWRDEHPDRIDPDGVEPSGAIVGYQIATFRGRGMNRDESLIEVGQEVILTTVKAGRKPKPVDFKAVVVDLFKCEM
ncbi:MAG: ABC transporter permease, partial [Planctomycetia bacterium]